MQEVANSSFICMSRTEHLHFLCGDYLANFPAESPGPVWLKL